MSESQGSKGYFHNGLPYNRLGHGPRVLVVLQGLVFEHKPLTERSARFMLSAYGFLAEEYTTYVVARKPGLPSGYSMQDMARDYAVMIREEFDGPVDVLGTSTGGSIAQHLAADHPELVRRLVLHASAHTLGEAGKEVQMRVGHLARQGKWRKASSTFLTFILSTSHFGKIAAAIGSLFMAWTAPDDASDLVVMVEAEDKHDFRARLGEIRAPALVIAGARDPCYTEALLRETAAGIPNARLILYPEKGHAPAGKRFERDVLAFLQQDVREQRS